MYDVIVVGAGPAGLAAGIQLVLFGLNTLILETKEEAGGIAVEQYENPNIPAILNILIKMKNNAKSNKTIKETDKTLTSISKHADLNQPETVKQYIANKTASNGTKRNYCTAYNRYCQYYQIQWKMPKYKPQAKNRRIPTTKQLEMLIARASPRLSLKLRISKETGLRPIELCNLKIKDIDTSQRLIYPTTAKNGSARTLKISSNLNTTLQNHINIRKLNQNDKIFKGTSANYGTNYREMRNNLARKLNNQQIKNIKLYDFRHYFASMLYHKTRDILYVKQQMGHKQIETTLIYTQLLNLTDDEWTCKTAKTVKEAEKLAEAGFNLFDTIGDIHIYRKRK